ncbi:MAG: basic secretory family protein [Thaumarchaeota archaeon]|nr:basic secretory family protein [Nitrososphaerota archaeon]MCL5319122.1 basic secretory family protein [Nitrososphaerota archaeon]
MKPTQPPVVKGKYCKVDYSKTPTEQEYARHVATLADEVIPKIKSLHTGRDSDAEITFMLERGLSSPAATAGKTVYLNLDHFDRIAKVYGSREADDGAIVHETDHAIMYAPRYDSATAWLIEGIADYIRDKLGYERETKGAIRGSYPHFEEGKATSDYQVTAYFLMFLEKLSPTIVEDLASEMVENTYSAETFKKLLGKPLIDLVKTYSDEERNKPE